MKIKDELKTRQTVGGVNFPKLKGTVSVQLFNAKTGELEKEVKGTRAEQSLFGK